MVEAREHEEGQLSSPSAPPLVSIVTPVYNGARYLRECIESVLAQTYHNWEYTIVDNCSTDGSTEIARQYAGRDARIRVHENLHFVPSVTNHNGALRQISPASKYVKVVFGDDWIFPECLERMVALAEEHPSVGLVSAYCLEGQRVTCAGLPYSTEVLSGKEFGRRHLLDRLYVFGSANTVLYRADLVRSRVPFYNEANIHADTEVCFDLLKTCDFGFAHQVLTFTRIRSGSLTTASTDIGTNFAGMLQVLAKHGPDYLTASELEARVERHLIEYYRFLGKRIVMGANQKFWEYHRRQLTGSAYGFSRLRLVRGILAYWSDALLNPKETVEKILLMRARRRAINHGDRAEEVLAEADVVGHLGASETARALMFRAQGR